MDADYLKKIGRMLAGAEQSPWEPSCVVRAFATPLPEQWVFRMQTWSDLEAIRSPLLQDELPLVREEAQGALRIFGGDPDLVTDEELALLMVALRETIREARAMALVMTTTGTETLPDQGFGTWLLILGRLRADGSSLGEALQMPVGQAYALTAVTKAIRGWRVSKGMPYAHRDAAAEGQSDNQTIGQSEGEDRG